MCRHIASVKSTLLGKHGKLMPTAMERLILAKLAARRHVALDIKAPPAGVGGFTPLWPLYKVEHTIAQLGRWRRLSRCYEGTEASARAWLEVASVGYLAPGARLPERSVIVPAPTSARLAAGSLSVRECASLDVLGTPRQED